ncbi:hypothetical protein ACIQXQ_17060 [Peribacillus sp. NPDC097198]|uniref:hypothetical protein n=1 Tax=Peribacillus sp. NPDC097198 TaxID=3364397 RepID=UPI003809C1D5
MSQNGDTYGNNYPVINVNPKGNVNWTVNSEGIDARLWAINRGLLKKAIKLWVSNIKRGQTNFICDIQGFENRTLLHKDRFYLGKVCVNISF